MPNGETLEKILERIQREGMELSFSKTERRFMMELGRVRKTDYDDFIKYLIRYKNMRADFIASFYE